MAILTFQQTIFVQDVRIRTESVRYRTPFLFLKNVSSLYINVLYFLARFLLYINRGTDKKDFSNS